MRQCREDAKSKECIKAKEDQEKKLANNRALAEQMVDYYVSCCADPHHRHLRYFRLQVY